jgi:hypothetical protein
MKLFYAIGVAALPNFASAALVLDGLKLEPEWRQAVQITDLKVTQPDSGAVPGFNTTVSYLALPDGLALFFDNTQDPVRYPKRAARQPRDSTRGTDRVNVMVDFDGTGEAGYNYTLSRSDSIDDATISNENLFNGDWDGLWYHAVSEHSDGNGWNAELLIPWSSALMRKASGDTREIGLYVDRVLGVDETRAAYPALVFFKPKFLSLFSKVQIATHSQGLLRVYPYLTALSDFVANRVEFRSGADIFWKPSSDFQLTATINPDFGQVEADDLVVNFDAVESFFSDKRPFFTENQAAFVRQSPEEEQLIYTRRIGGSRDDGRGASDIDAAVKLSGSYAGLDLGLFAVRERDPDFIGRSVTALRVKKPGDRFDVGYLGSYVERPFFDRTAAVHAFDAQFSAGAWLWNTTLLRSEINTAGALKNGTGGFTSLSYKPSAAFDVRGDLAHYGKSLDYNDLGFQRRANLAYYELTPSWQQNTYPDTHWLRSSNIRLDLNMAENSAGRNLYEDYGVRLGLNYRDGASGQFEFTYGPAGIDDLVSRGNGALQLGSSKSFFTNYDSVRHGNVSGSVDMYLEQNPLNGHQAYLGIGARYWIGDDFNARINVDGARFRNRTLWRSGTLFGVFKQSDSVEPNLQMEWFQGSHHELRVKAQWLAVRGRDARAFRLQTNERLAPSATDAIGDFAVSSFGFQLRYRYKINPESDIFAVYSRGGDAEFQPSLDRGDRQSLGGLLSDSLELRDADQFLLKARVAF